jgi:hypothetical protein
LPTILKGPKIQIKSSQEKHNKYSQISITRSNKLLNLAIRIGNLMNSLEEIKIRFGH